MKTTARFERAVKLLYEDFQSGDLNPYDCKRCAAGNLCGHTSEWAHYRHLLHPYMDSPGSERINQDFKNRFPEVGYNAAEILRVEAEFMSVFSGSHNRYNRHLQFAGLQKVLKYLAKLDNIQGYDDLMAPFKEVLQAKKDNEKWHIENDTSPETWGGIEISSHSGDVNFAHPTRVENAVPVFSGVTPEQAEDMADTAIAKSVINTARNTFMGWISFHR